jgi:hypothetical protein
MPGKQEGHPLWVKVAFVGGLLILAFIVSRGCQEEQIKVSDEEAVAAARERIDFEPTDTQVRLLRQGLSREPFWFVSLALESKRDPDVYARLAVIKVNAETGEVESVEQDRDRDREAADKARQQAGEPVEP